MYIDNDNNIDNSGHPMNAAQCSFPLNVLIETTVSSVNNKTDTTEQLLSQASVD